MVDVTSSHFDVAITLQANKSWNSILRQFFYQETEKFWKKFGCILWKSDWHC